MDSHLHLFRQRNGCSHPNRMQDSIYTSFDRPDRTGHACKLLYFSTKEVRCFLLKADNVLLFYLNNIVAGKDNNWSDSNSLLQSPDQCIPIFDYQFHCSLIRSLFLVHSSANNSFDESSNSFSSASSITLTHNNQHLIRPDPPTDLLMH